MILDYSDRKKQKDREEQWFKIEAAATEASEKMMAANPASRAVTSPIPLSPRSLDQSPDMDADEGAGTDEPMHGADGPESLDVLTKELVCASFGL